MQTSFWLEVVGEPAFAPEQPPVLEPSQALADRPCLRHRVLLFLAIDLKAFNALPAGEAEERLYETFAEPRWAELIAAARPFRDVDALMKAAEDAWGQLRPDDWVRTFKAHPRIGESGGHAPATSEAEQSGVRKASAATLAALATENRRYEARLGHVFLIAARGRTVDDILLAIRQRMNNDPVSELEVAALEQRKITRMRLLEMLGA